jgi:hypothetical protein
MDVDQSIRELFQIVGILERKIERMCEWSVLGIGALKAFDLTDLGRVIIFVD